MGKGKRSKEVKSNITDPESAKKAGFLLLQNQHFLHPCKSTISKGTIQGYNGVAAVDNRRSLSSMTSRHLNRFNGLEGRVSG